ncbi:MAG: hypothetical protein ACSHW2_02400, partial [Parasphingopyxis sp.]
MFLSGIGNRLIRAVNSGAAVDPGTIIYVSSVAIAAGVHFFPFGERHTDANTPCIRTGYAPGSTAYPLRRIIFFNRSIFGRRFATFR